MNNTEREQRDVHGVCGVCGVCVCVRVCTTVCVHATECKCTTSNRTCAVLT